MTTRHAARTPSRPGNAPIAVLVTLLCLAVMAGLALGFYWSLSSGVERAQALEAESRVGASTIAAVLDASRSFIEQEAYGKAEAVLTSAVGEHPEDVELRLALAEVLLLSGERVAEAYAQHEAALAVEPNAPEVQFAAGSLASTLGRADRAVEHYGMARAADPDQPRYVLFLAAAQLKSGETEEAKVNFLHALHLDPADPTAAGALATIALDENERELALNYARRAREADPGGLAYVVLEARALQRLGRPQEALDMLLALPDEQLHGHGVLSVVGACFGLLREPGRAAELYAQAAEAHPGDSELAFQAALWFERAEDAERARSFAQRARMLGHEQAGAVMERLASPEPGGG